MSKLWRSQRTHTMRAALIGGLAAVALFLLLLNGVRAFGSRTAFAEQWERTAYSMLLIAVALTGVGSGYYHAWPSEDTLFWGRLPMAVMFMALLTATIGGRISPRAGRVLLLPLLAAGTGSRCGEMGRTNRLCMSGWD